jgi:hypothetical protein
MKLNHVMVDIETLDTAASAAILSIGAVRFDADTIGETFYREISRASNLISGRTVSASTVKWWMGQSEDARKILDSEHGVSLITALHDFNDFVGFESTLWGNGSMFDNAILRSACESVEIEPVWSYRNDACYRTLKKCFPEIEMVNKPKIAHHALEDAMAQALHAQLLFITINSCHGP